MDSVTCGQKEVRTAKRKSDCFIYDMKTVSSQLLSLPKLRHLDDFLWDAWYGTRTNTWISVRQNGAYSDSSRNDTTCELNVTERNAHTPATEVK